jgi:hypothetical protein
MHEAQMQWQGPSLFHCVCCGLLQLNSTTRNELEKRRNRSCLHYLGDITDQEGWLRELTARQGPTRAYGTKLVNMDCPTGAFKNYVVQVN